MWFEQRRKRSGCSDGECALSVGETALFRHPGVPGMTTLQQLICFPTDADWR